MITTLLLSLSTPAALAAPCPVPNQFFALAGKGGKNLVTYQGAPTPGYYATFGLENLSLPGHLVMESRGSVYVSRNRGCAWENLGSVGASSPMWMTPAAGGQAYGFTLNGNGLYRIDYDGADFSLLKLRSPYPSIMGVGADPVDPLIVHLGDDNGQIWRSEDGGSLWTAIGGTPAGGPFLSYRMAFDPADPDHAVFGVATQGAFVTFDGGVNWTSATGLSQTDGPVNLFNVVVSPADSDVVWAMALDLDESDAGDPSGGKHIYRSVDGGLSFVPLVDNGPVILTNGPELTPHPTNPDRIAWVHGSSFSGLNIYQYDAVYDGVLNYFHPGLLARKATYYPADPRHMYLGMEGF